MAKGDTDGVYCSAVESVVWACALDDILGQAEPGYEARREADIDGRLLVGIRWARNRGVHNVLSLHEVHHGPPVYVTYPERWWDFTWLDRDRIPTAGRPAPLQERAYDEHLSGESVEATLASVYRFLTTRPSEQARNR